MGEDAPSHGGVRPSQGLLTPPPGSSPARGPRAPPSFQTYAPLHPFLIGGNFIQEPERAPPACEDLSPRLAEELVPTGARGAPGPTRPLCSSGAGLVAWAQPSRPCCGLRGRTALATALGRLLWGGPTVLNLLPDTWNADVKAGAAAAAFGHAKARVFRGGAAPSPKSRVLCGGRVAWAPRRAAPCSGLTRTHCDFVETTTPESHAG